MTRIDAASDFFGPRVRSSHAGERMLKPVLAGKPLMVIGNAGLPLSSSQATLTARFENAADVDPSMESMHGEIEVGEGQPLPVELTARPGEPGARRQDPEDVVAARTVDLDRLDPAERHDAAGAGTLAARRPARAAARSR